MTTRTAYLAGIASTPAAVALTAVVVCRIHKARKDQRISDEIAKWQKVVSETNEQLHEAVMRRLAAVGDD